MKYKIIDSHKYKTFFDRYAPTEEYIVTHLNLSVLDATHVADIMTKVKSMVPIGWQQVMTQAGTNFPNQFKEVILKHRADVLDHIKDAHLITPPTEWTLVSLYFLQRFHAAMDAESSLKSLIEDTLSQSHPLLKTLQETSRWEPIIAFHALKLFVDISTMLNPGMIYSTPTASYFILSAFAELEGMPDSLRQYAQYALDKNDIGILHQYRYAQKNNMKDIFPEYEKLALSFPAVWWMFPSSALDIVAQTTAQTE